MSGLALTTNSPTYTPPMVGLADTDPTKPSVGMNPIALQPLKDNVDFLIRRAAPWMRPVLVAHIASNALTGDEHAAPFGSFGNPALGTFTHASTGIYQWVVPYARWAQVTVASQHRAASVLITNRGLINAIVQISTEDLAATFADADFDLEVKSSYDFLT